MSRVFSPSDLHCHHALAGLAAHPCEPLLACQVTRDEVDADRSCSRIWCVPLDGAPAWPMTQDGHRDRDPRWAPDGRSLVFVSDRPVGNASSRGQERLFRIRRDGGEAQPLGAWPGAVVRARWAPDSRRLAVLVSLPVDPERRGARGPRPQRDQRAATDPQVVWRLAYKLDGTGYLLDREVHLFVLHVDDGQCEQLTDGPFDVRDAQWSPDGRYLAWVRTREGDDAHRTDLWCMEVRSRRCWQVSHDQAHVQAPVWAPDGHCIVFSGAERAGDAQVRLWRADWKEGHTSVEGLGSEDIEIAQEAESVQWDTTGDARRLWFLWARRGVQGVATAQVPGGAAQMHVTGPRQLQSLAQVGEWLAFVVCSPTVPMEVHACRRDGSEERQVTQFNAWWKDRERPVLQPRHFTVTDGDGQPVAVDGWLIAPAGLQGPAPLLVDLHGGPASFALLDFASTVYWHVLVGQGWRVLLLNASGSASFGRAHAERLRGRWGELDWPEHWSAVQALQQEGLADARVAVAGKSYGGYLAAWAIGHCADLRAAVAIAPVTQLETHWGTSDSGPSADTHALGAPRDEARERYRRLSPLTHAHRATTPTLILQGAQDERCPRSQAEDLFVTLRSHQGRHAELVLYPQASHTLTVDAEPSVRRDGVERIVQWLTRWTLREGGERWREEAGDT